MRTEIISLRWSITEAMADHISIRLKHLEHRFGDHVNSMAVRLTDINGPKGGDDKVCRLQARVENHPSINTEGRHTDIYTAIAQATHRMERSLGSILDESRSRNPRSRHHAGFPEGSRQLEKVLSHEEEQHELPNL